MEIIEKLLLEQHIKYIFYFLKKLYINLDAICKISQLISTSIFFPIYIHVTIYNQEKKKDNICIFLKTKFINSMEGASHCLENEDKLLYRSLPSHCGLVS